MGAHDVTRAIVVVLLSGVLVLGVAAVLGIALVHSGGHAGSPKNPTGSKVVNRAQLPSSHVDDVVAQFERGNEISILQAIETSGGVWWVRAGAHPSGGGNGSSITEKVPSTA